MRIERDIDIELVQRGLDMIAAKTTTLAAENYSIPAENYSSQDRFNKEHAALFVNRPQVVGLSADLPTNGSSFVTNLAEASILVVRGKEGGVKAFLNICRHRAGRVAEGRTDGGVFTCPYHSWSYDLDGHLIGQPAANLGGGFEGLTKECSSLIEVPAAEESGLLYVNPNPKAEPIDVKKELAGLGPELADVAFDDFILIAERESTWNMNWKQPQDTFLEAYHIFSLHKNTLAPNALSAPMVVDDFGPHGRGVIMQRSSKKMMGLPREQLTARNQANIVYWIFPNTVLNLPSPGHAEIWQFYPDEKSPTRTRAHTRFYCPKDGQPSFYNDMVDFTMKFVGEDFDMQEGILKNARSGNAPDLLCGRNEPALIHFHKAIDELLQGSEFNQGNEPSH